MQCMLETCGYAGTTKQAAAFPQSP
uniref:Uncharacterized protein n=1 Tax=Anguilla anguilla TaxID=7936 RepID=A0A0E9TW26_ANGAN